VILRAVVGLIYAFLMLPMVIVVLAASLLVARLVAELVGA